MSGSNPSYQLPLSPHQHPLDKSSSWLQKACRRGLENDALYAAGQLEANFPDYVWRRIFVIAVEDVGLADPGLPARLLALYEITKLLGRKPEQRMNRRANLVMAVMLVVRAP